MRRNMPRYQKRRAARERAENTVASTSRSPAATFGETVLVWSHPPYPWPAGSRSPGGGGGRYSQRSTRCQYCHMFSACHDGSLVRLAISSQSLSCGTTVIIALCAVQPPSVPARG